MVNKKETAGSSGEGQTQTPHSDLQARDASKEIRRTAKMLVLTGREKSTPLYRILMGCLHPGAFLFPPILVNDSVFVLTG